MTKPVSNWIVPLAACLLLTLFLAALFWPTLDTMFTLWANVETYSHGFLILPISLWLIWRRREQLFSEPARPSPWVLLLTLLMVSGWALTDLLGIQVLEQLALIAVWITGLWAIIGHRAARLLAFPLLFLFMMVPMGDSLVPPMMEFTADFTVWMLELSGIPVYREGLYFVIPSGNWSVVEACSGVRYLIASGTLGLLYAYLTYRTLWRRALFVLLAILVPILANGLRAYMIVMIGHLSDMQLAVGVDHLIYGWVFFGVVMLILFWLGNFWIEKTPAPSPPPVVAHSAEQSAPLGAITAVLIAALVLAAGARSTVQELGSASADMAVLTPPSNAGGWQLQDAPGLTWPVQVQRPDQLVQVSYRKAGAEVTLVLGVFRQQRQGGEVISSENQLLSRDADSSWRVVNHGKLIMPIDGESLGVPVFGISQQNSYLLSESKLRLLAVHWYRLGDRHAANEYLGKWYQALALLVDARSDGAFVMLGTVDEGDAPERLQAFAREALPAIWTALDSGR